MNPETALQNDIRAAIGTARGVIVWRNNVGVATHCDRWRECSQARVCLECGAPIPVRGELRRVRYGLAPGSADLICCVDGRFVAGEVKARGGRPTKQQRAWLESVKRVGGQAAIWRSVEDAITAVEGARR